MESTIKEADITLHELVASGGSAEVHRATWRSSDRGELEVAAKKIRVQSEGGLKEQLDLEVEILQKLNHKNVIKYYGHIVTPTHLIIVTEFAAKGSLRNCLRKTKNMDPKLIHKWAIQAARGIKHLKQVGVLHRDIKSSNFLITADDTLKIGDFGIAKQQETTLDTSHRERGTLPWLAPEVIKDGKLSPKADIYALGIVLWELNTGEVPYKGMKPEHLMFQVVASDLRPEAPNECPVPEHKQLMQECWTKNRQWRPPIEEVVSRLERAGGWGEEDEEFGGDPDGEKENGGDQHDGGNPRTGGNRSAGGDLYAGGRLTLDAEPFSGSIGSGAQASQPMEVEVSNTSGPVQETKPHISSVQVHAAQVPASGGSFQEARIPAAASTPLQDARHPGAGTLPPDTSSPAVGVPPQSSNIPYQSAEEDAWEIISSFNISNMQKRDLNRKILHASTETLCNHLLPDNMLPKLKSRNVLDDGDVADIKSYVRTDAMVDRLLEILKRKNDKAYGYFMEALKDTDIEVYREVRAIEKRIIMEWKNAAMRSRPFTEESSRYQTSYRPYEDVTKISDRDFHDVIVRLGPDELQKLYRHLGLRWQAVEKAERRADTTDEELKAIEVLRQWRQVSGRKASRGAILDALRLCENMEVVGSLERQWNIHQ